MAIMGASATQQCGLCAVLCVGFATIVGSTTSTTSTTSTGSTSVAPPRNSFALVELPQLGISVDRGNVRVKMDWRLATSVFVVLICLCFCVHRIWKQLRELQATVDLIRKDQGRVLKDFAQTGAAAGAAGADHDGQTLVQDIFYKTPYGRKLHMNTDCASIPVSSRKKCSKEEVCLVCIDKYIRGKREERQQRGQATGGA